MNDTLALRCVDVHKRYDDGAGIAADVRMGTLGKALGTFGAFAAGSEALVELLVNRARSFVFTTALPASMCSVASTSASKPGQRSRLWAQAARASPRCSIFWGGWIRSAAVASNWPEKI